jgi:hypothetical protein
MLKHLHPWEIMTLLAYPWRGNVRELQAACLDMELFHSKDKKNISILWLWPGSISSVKKEHTDLSWRACFEYYQDMKKSRIDVKFLEEILNKFGLGLDTKNKKKPFEKIKPSPLSCGEIEWNDDEFKTRTLGDINEFQNAKKGMIQYCLFFYKYLESKENLLVRLNYKPDMAHPTFVFIEHLTKQHDKLAKDILEYLLKIKIPKDLKEKSLIHMEMPEYEEWFSKLLEAVPKESNPNGSQAIIIDARKPSKSPFELKESDLLRQYYLYHKDKGLKVSEAARAAGHKDSTFRDKLKKVNITPWR